MEVVRFFSILNGVWSAKQGLDGDDRIFSIIRIMKFLHLHSCRYLILSMKKQRFNGNSKFHIFSQGFGADPIFGNAPGKASSSAPGPVTMR